MKKTLLLAPLTAALLVLAACSSNTYAPTAPATTPTATPPSAVQTAPTAPTAAEPIAPSPSVAVPTAPVTAAPVTAPKPVTPPAATPKVTPTVKAETHRVSISNFSFNPSSLTVKSGDTVVWTNNDPMQHTVTGSDFDLGPISSGTSVSHTFSKAGSFDYHCKIHSSMHGNVTVE